MADLNVPFPGGGRETLVTVRDRLFRTLFFRLSLGYARACNATARRLIETLILLKVGIIHFLSPVMTFYDGYDVFDALRIDNS